MNNPCAYFGAYWWYPGILIQIEGDWFSEEKYLVFLVADSIDGQIRDVDQEDVSVFRTDERVVEFCNRMNTSLEVTRNKEGINIPEDKPEFKWSGK